jgi:RNA-directed DNA polymerase
MTNQQTAVKEKLKLRVNRAKSAVTRYHERGFLGFGFTSGKNLKIKLTDTSLMRFKDRIREITRRSHGIPLVQAAEDLRVFLRGGFRNLFDQYQGH